MCIRVCVLGSGSKGNCIYVGFDKTHILIDAGLPIRRIERFVAAMGIAPSALSVLITHSHRDHIGSLDALTEKYSPAVYISEKSRGLMPECRNGAEESRIYFGDEDFFVGNDLPDARSLIQIRNRKQVCPTPQETDERLRHTMSIGVGLHHGNIFYTAGKGVFYVSNVGFEPVEIDLYPRP